MTNWQKTMVTSTRTGEAQPGDILDKSDKRLQVALDGTTISITMYKNTKQDELYVGNVSGMEFTSTGD